MSHTHASMSARWVRLVRFVNGAGQVRVGEPVGPAGTYAHARLLDSDDPLRPGAALTDAVEPIAQVLAHATRQLCPYCCCRWLTRARAGAAAVMVALT
jgi:hypothetical protein